MIVLVYCKDKPDGLALRKATRATHLEYMIAAKEKIIFGGPLLSGTGDSVGSVFALRVDTRAEVDAFLAAEPYCLAGLFEEVQVHAMRQMMPENPVGTMERELALEYAAREPVGGRGEA
ncbi:YciI family protein [Streptomyces sp. NPDC002928]|uniref:YciI family protein n=1 Tax=Streptomyces sp. NPDC002928 TaxID=3154440 RepID=UPI0033A116DA